MTSLFWVALLYPYVDFVTFSVDPKKLVKIVITEVVVVTVEVIVLGGLDAVVHVTAIAF